MKSRTIGFVVAGFWLLMMGLLGYREFGSTFISPSRQPTAGEAVAGFGETWMGLFVEEERVGHLHMRQDSEERYGLSGATMDIEVRAVLNLLGQQTDLDLSGSIWRPDEEKRADFHFAVSSASYDFRISGQLGDGLLKAEVLTAGEALPLEVPIEEDLVFSGGFGTALQFPMLEVGEEARLESFDPLSRRKSLLRVRSVAEETLAVDGESIATKRLEVMASGFRSLVWIDFEGGVVQMKTPFGLTLRRINGDPTGILESSPKEISSELLALTALKPQGKRPFRGARSSLIRFVTEAGLPLPEDRIQRPLGDHRYRVVVPEMPALEGSALMESEAESYLSSDAFVQSDHPKIRQQAAAIVGEEKDAWTRALKIHRWVYESLQKEPVVSVPSALEVLEKKRGDCNEHTVLFTALARASSLPTRIAIGLVWSDQLESFYYHAWPEVYLGDWVWMDPTLNQPLADATHIKLLNGGVEAWAGFARLGRLEIEILEIE